MMARTFFQDFTRDNGLPVTVEYSASAGATILKSWPNTPEHNALHAEYIQLTETSLQGKSISTVLAIFNDEARAERIEELKCEIQADEERAELSDAERERMEEWLAEHHEDEPDDYF